MHEEIARYLPTGGDAIEGQVELEEQLAVVRARGEPEPPIFSNVPSSSPCRESTVRSTESAI